jgi:uncharacterized membrane protein YphA (DoxX/SURF4 family)
MRSLEQLQPSVTVYLRVALAAAFLSAVADRFGLWGPFGTPNVAWGEFGRFVAYVGKLNWFVPEGLWPPAAWLSTAAELSLGLLLLVGLWTRVAAVLSALLLLVFALAMTVALGPEAPLAFSVWSASAGAALLATLPEPAYVWTLDHWLHRESTQRNASASGRVASWGVSSTPQSGSRS